jgi:hypothetical protein
MAEGICETEDYNKLVRLVHDKRYGEAYHLSRKYPSLKGKLPRNLLTNLTDFYEDKIFTLEISKEHPEFCELNEITNRD